MSELCDIDGIKLKTVSPGQTILPEHHNNAVDALKKILSLLYIGIPSDPDLPKLNSAIDAIRYVSHGDTILNSDWNNTIAAIKLARDIIAKYTDTTDIDFYISFLKEVKTGDLVKSFDRNMLYHTLCKLYQKAQTALIAPSGLDPYDTPWATAEGWTKVWNFDTTAELEEFADTKENAYVQNSVLTFSGSGHVFKHEADKYLKRAAICVKVIPFYAAQSWPVCYLLSERYIPAVGGQSGEGSIYVTENNDLLALVARGNISQTFNFSNYKDYYVLVVSWDYDAGIVTANVYNKHKTKIAEQSASLGGTLNTNWEVHIQAKDTTDLKFMTFVDWVAVLEA